MCFCCLFVLFLVLRDLISLYSPSCCLRTCSVDRADLELTEYLTTSASEVLELKARVPCAGDNTNHSSVWPSPPGTQGLRDHT